MVRRAGRNFSVGWPHARVGGAGRNCSAMRRHPCCLLSDFVGSGVQSSHLGGLGRARLLWAKADAEALIEAVLRGGVTEGKLINN